jgi:chlorite dismutase
LRSEKKSQRDSYIELLKKKVKQKMHRHAGAEECDAQQSPSQRTAGKIFFAALASNGVMNDEEQSPPQHASEKIAHLSKRCTSSLQSCSLWQDSFVDPLDISEKGGMRGGVRQTSDRRLFMQFLAFGGSGVTGGDSTALRASLDDSGLDGVLYEDANDPHGVGLLTWSDDPGFFISKVRPLFQGKTAFSGLNPKPEYTMMGRTYALGHEPNLEDWLLHRSPKSVTNPQWPWAVWYPLRRKGEFNALPHEEQTAILREHGRIGHSFGEAGLALDVRLACFGIDKNDNDFVIGLIGQDLYPLSACVQAMRKTRQTSTLMEHMGPFFVGKAVWQRNSAADPTY